MTLENNKESGEIEEIEIKNDGRFRLDTFILIS